MTLDKALQQLRDASQPVPKPLRLPTAAEVDAAERDIGIAFHPDYRRFQLEASNVVVPVLEPAVVLPDMGYLDLRETVKDAREIGVPCDVIPFCQDNGDYFFITRDGEIGLWDHNGGGTVMLRKSLADWITEDWLGGAGEAG